MRGTLLNTATVTAGAGLGLVVGSRVPEDYQSIALTGLGLVTVAMGLRSFLAAKNVPLVAAAVALGGLLGLALVLQAGLQSLGDWVRQVVGAGGSSTFVEGFVGASVLFCVGPMTLLGCLQDGLEGKTDLLAIKSTLDGVAGFFLAAALGPGVLLSAAVVLVLQGALTLLARRLRRLAEDEELLGELTGTGGVLLLGIGIGLMGMKKIPVADFLPALALAPLFLTLARRRTGKVSV